MKLLIPAQIALAVLVAGFSGPATASSAGDATAQREAAVLLARAGDPDTAIEILIELRAEFPFDARVQSDLVTLLEQTGQPQRAVDAARGLNPLSVPDFTLLAWARSLRALDIPEAVVAMLGLEGARDPRDPDIDVLRALALSDLDRDNEAATLLQNLRRQYPDSVEAAAAEAYVLRRLGQPAGSLAAASSALALNPEHREAARQRVLALAEVGAPDQALALTTPGLLDTDEYHSLQQDRVAVRIRWALLEEENSTARRSWIDEALSILDTLQASPGIDPQRVQRLEHDRIVALRADGRMPEVLDAYERLTDTPPAFVNHAAADAYLASRDPERAIALYRDVLARDGSQLEVELGLAYALVEAERHAEAIALLDDMARARPAWFGDETGAVRAPNWERLRVDITAAMFRAYANQPADAQARLEALAADAPASAQVRRELATVYRWRGWPNRALSEIELAQAYEPEVLAGRIEHALALAALERFAAADAYFGALEEAFPHSPTLDRELQRWRDRQRWHLATEAGYVDSDGFADFGSRERWLGTRVSAPYLGYAWQPYAFQHWASARFPEGDRAWRRAGAGLNWRHQRRHAYVEFSRSLTGPAETGITGGFDWHVGDHWSFATRAETFSLQAPLRPRDERLSGRNVELATRWQAHESLDTRISLGRLTLSDGNTRLSMVLSTNHRLRASAHHLTVGHAELYSSRASQTGGLYFNPQRDAALNYGVQHDWLTWRHYDRAFTQRFAVTAGTYWQQDFGTAATGRLRYEHVWQLSRSWQLRYGAGIASRVYDGNRERHRDALLALEGYF